MQIPLAAPLVLRPAETTSTLVVSGVYYSNATRTAQAYVQGVPDPVLLWEGDAYDTAGQWTDADVEARLLEVLGLVRAPGGA